MEWRSRLNSTFGSLFPSSKGILLLVIFFANACASTKLPNALKLIHSPRFYRHPTEFVGDEGPLTRAQGERIIHTLEQRTGDLNLLQKHLAFEQAISREPLVLGNKVTLLENGSATYNAMFRAIEGATDSINVETYMFTDDSIGRKFADEFIAKQRQGVQVNIIYDSFGAWTTPQSFFDRMERAGVRVLQFNPINPEFARLRWLVDHRDHRKLMVIDGRIAILGGINISGVYSSGFRGRETKREREGPPQYWRDTDVEIEGPVVAQCQEFFIATWTAQHGDGLPPRNYYPSLKREGNEIVRIIGSVPERFSRIYVTLFSAIANSEKNVWITDPYFAPEPELIKVLQDAARRGVDVRLLLPSHANEPLIDAAARSHYSELMRAGVKIYEWRGVMLHAKTATIDGVWSTVGSSNLDTWSILRNNEITAVVLGTRFGDAMDAMFEDDLKNSNRIDPTRWRERGVIEKVHEDVGWLAQPLL